MRKRERRRFRRTDLAPGRATASQLSVALSPTATETRSGYTVPWTALRAMEHENEDLRHARRVRGEGAGSRPGPRTQLGPHPMHALAACPNAHDPKDQCRWPLLPSGIHARHRRPIITLATNALLHLCSTKFSQCCVSTSSVNCSTLRGGPESYAVTVHGSHPDIESCTTT